MPALDGWVRTDGSFNAGFPAPVGDLDASAPGTSSTACYTFELGAIAPGSQILNATLRVDVISSQGDPHAEHGVMQVHYVPYGDSLANAPLTAVLEPPAPVPVTPSDTAPGTRRADVRTLLQRAIDDGSSRLQVQIGFLYPVLVFNGADDVVTLNDGEDLVPGAAPPLLTWEWTEP